MSTSPSPFPHRQREHHLPPPLFMSTSSSSALSYNSQPLPSPASLGRRHSFETLATPSPTVIGFAFDGDTSSQLDHSKPAGRTLSVYNSDPSFALLPAPQRPSASRIRSASYSAAPPPRPQSFVPNYSMPLQHRSNSPAQWAFTQRASPSALRSSGFTDTMDEGLTDEESPLDTAFLASAIPAKPLTSLPLSLTEEAEELRSEETTPPPQQLTDSPVSLVSPLPSLSRPTSIQERRLSAVAIAAISTPPRNALYKSTSRNSLHKSTSSITSTISTTPTRPPPSIPPKSAARVSQSSIKRRSDQSDPDSSFSNSASAPVSTYLPPPIALQPQRPPSVASIASTPIPPTILSPSTPILGLSHPRPRQTPLNRTPSLSQAGSSSSRASSSVFSPSSSAITRSSMHSGDGTDWARTSVSESDQGKDEGEMESLNSSSRSSHFSSHRTPVKLRLDSADRPPQLGMGFGGLGIEGLGSEGIEDDDLQRGLDDLARYAQSLPSPIPPLDPEQEPSWRGFPSSADEDKTVMLEQLPIIEDSPVSLSRTPSEVNLSTRVLRQPQSRASLHPHASTGNISHAGSSRRRQRTSTGSTLPSESDAYLSVDESGLDECTTDEEGEQNPFLLFKSKKGRKSDTQYTYRSGALIGDGMDQEVLHSTAVSKREDRIEDASGGMLEELSVSHDTTHLILARTTTPWLVDPLLRRSIPTVAYGLTVLDISYCQLAEIPEVIGSCSSLKEFDIKGNTLSAAVLPPFFATLVSLKILIADSCGLISLPTPLDSLRHLHTLSVRSNALHSLPGWLSRLPRLDTLLVDDNDFHWQWANLVAPILAQSRGPAPLMGSDGLSPLPTGSGSEFAVYSARSSYSAGGASPMPSSGVVTPASSHPDLRHVPSNTSLRVEEGTFQPGSAPPSVSPAQHSFSTPPPSSAPHIDLAEAQARLRHHSDSPAPSSPAPSSAESTKKWGKMFKKVSINKIRPSTARPGGLTESARTFSQPVTSSEASTVENKLSGGSLFRNRVLSKPTKVAPAPLALIERERRTLKRHSFLKLEPVSPFRATMVPGIAEEQAAPHVVVDHKAGLRSVMAYLRDLDDLSFEAPVPTAPSPNLRLSPSLGSLKRSPDPNVGVRRAQSSRKLPTRTRSRADSAISTYGEDDGRSTPLANGTPPLPKLRVDPVRRSAVVNEIIQTEKSYLRGLQELCDIYIAAGSVPVASSTGKRDTLVPILERKAVFGNVDAIRAFHENTFLPDLMAAAEPILSLPPAVESTQQAERVAEVFIRHVAFLKIYSSYVNAFDSALTRLQSWTADSRPGTASGTNRSNSLTPSDASKISFDPTIAAIPALSSNQKKRIKSYLKRCRMSPRHSQISLESYLLLPVQRVPRYRMLLESLVSCTPHENLSEDASLEPNPVIEHALELIGDVALQMNERKRESEGRQQLLAWQSRIGSNFRSPLVQPHRSLVRSGTFTLVRTVKRSSTSVDSSWPPGASPTPSSESQRGLQIHSLHTETLEQRLIALLCSDIIVFVKEPHDQSDPMAPVDLFTVLRLSNHDGTRERPPPATLFGNESDNMLRLVCDSRAILYVKCAHRADAISWCNSINLQKGLNS